VTDNVIDWPFPNKILGCATGIAFKTPLETRLGVCHSLFIKLHFCINPMTILVSHQTVRHKFCNKIALIGTATLKNTAQTWRTSKSPSAQSGTLTYQHVTSEIIPFGNITASYNTILVLDGELLWTLFVSTNVE